DLSGNPTFEEFLARVRETCLGAYVYQDVPFEKVVEVLAQGTGPTPQRDLSRTPLFQVMLVVQNAPRRKEMAVAGDLPGVELQPLAVGRTTSKFDLTFSLTESLQGLHCTCEYSTDLFKADTIRCMLAHFQVLLEGVVQNSQANLSDLPLLSFAEREQLLVEWNATQTDSTPEMTLHQLFEQQVARTPDAIAVTFEETCLTYGQLNQRANQLSALLRGSGIGPQSLV